MVGWVDGWHSFWTKLLCNYSHQRGGGREERREKRGERGRISRRERDWGRETGDERERGGEREEENII